MKAMRDAFFERLYYTAKQDKNVILVTADMGAPSLDEWRLNLPNQFINVGIAEQNMIAVAAGLALSGKKVYCYAIAPFVSLRCYEFLKVDVSLMNLPMVIVGVGAGFSYDDSGPTHHLTEDIPIMRALPNFEILCPSDEHMAASFATMSYQNRDNPIYIRLDRQNQKEKYLTYSVEDYEDGFVEYRAKQKKSWGKPCIIAMGNTVDMALEIREKHDVGVIDLFRLKPINEKKLATAIAKYDYMFTWEEHQLNGGLGSIISELIAVRNMQLPLTRFGIDDEYTYKYGGRKNIQKETGIDVEAVSKAMGLK